MRKQGSDEHARGWLTRPRRPPPTAAGYANSDVAFAGLHAVNVPTYCVDYTQARAREGGGGSGGGGSGCARGAAGAAR